MLVKITKRITTENKKKIENISAKAKRKYKISAKGRGREHVSEDAVIRDAINRLNGEEFINDIKNKL